MALTDTFVPPLDVRSAAARGLALRREFGRGGTSVGIARGIQLSTGRSVSLRTIKRMTSYFARHEVDKQGRDWSNKKQPSNGKIAWLLWGGDPGRSWARQILTRLGADRQ